MSPPRRKRLLGSALIVLAVSVASGCAAQPGSSSPVPTSQSTEGATEHGDFTTEALTTICLDATASGFAPDVQFDTDRVRIEQRSVSPEWLVIIPARTSGLDGRSLCTIGGEPGAPEIELASASIDPLEEAQIQNLIEGRNVGGTE